MNSPTSVYVIATIRAKAGKEMDAMALLTSLVQKTHTEAGCAKYALHQREDQKGTFYFVERWINGLALEQHLQSAHIASAMSRKDELFDSVDIALVNPIQAGDPEKGLLF